MSDQKQQSVPPLAGRNKCSECGSERLIRDKAEIVCMDCGFVIDERLADKGPEWRAFNKEQWERRRRVGSPVTFTIHDKGLSTTIGSRTNYWKNLSYERRAQLYRMKKWQRRVRIASPLERNLAFALSNLSKVCSSMNLPKNILETASFIYRKAMKKHLTRGHTIQSMVAAAIYMSCRKCRVARTLDEVVEASGVDRKKVGKNYRLIVRELEEFVPPTSPSHFVSRFANHLSLMGGAETVALRILGAAKKERLTSGRGPLGMAAATTYIASVLTNDQRTQREVAETAGVTEVTIRNRYKELLEKLNLTMKL